MEKHKKLYLSSYEMNEEIFFSRYNYIQDFSSPVHTHDFYEISLVIKGKFLHFKNGTENTIETNSILLITPNDIHALKGVDPVNTVYNFAFSEKQYNKIIQNFNLNMITYPDISITEYSFLTIMEKIKLYLTNKISIENILFSIFTDYIVFSNDLLKSSKYYSTIPVWLNNSIKEMEKPENFILGLQNFIKISGKSQEYLARSMKKFFNITATEWINNNRLEYSKILMQNTEKSILHILFETGFESESYFYRLFKKKYGITPKEYRDKNTPV